MIAAAAGYAVGQSAYKTYSNDRFYFSIEYPSALLLVQPPPANEDGRTFRSKDGKAVARVWGEFNVLDRTLEDEYDEAVADLEGGVTYKSLSENGFVVSGIRNGTIYYRRTLIRRSDTEVFYSFTIEYPKSQKSRFDSIVTRMSRSFKFDPNADI